MGDDEHGRLAGLAVLVSAATGLRFDDIEPIALPRLAGTSAMGVPLSRVTTQAQAVFLNRIGAGSNREAAAQSARAWLDDVAVSKSYRVANTGTLDAAVGDPRFTGRVIRVTRPGACDFCVLIHDRGYLPAHDGFAAHRACRCTASPEISSFATSRRSVRRGIAAAYEPGGGGGATPPVGGGGGGGGPGPERVLLTDATAGWRRTDLPTGNLPGAPARMPPSAARLRQAGLVADGWEHFEPTERAIAEQLRSLGIELGSVARASFRTPDAIIAGTDFTVEMKAPEVATFNAMRAGVRTGREQSPRLVLAIGDLAVTEDQAVSWLQRSLGRFGGGYQEVLVIGNGFGILWP